LVNFREEGNHRTKFAHAITGLVAGRPFARPRLADAVTLGSGDIGTAFTLN
jgi:hypothetical protein